ncbi:hypothetical protein [Marmoricola sp. RAF53]|uniref:hypothetical protein n=1 Tax=Marmoricola sp. RAF53 TaxID=3233059 RepID=UPI003F963513
MFIQVMQAPCTRQDELRALAESWRTEVGAGDGYLGGTFGFTDDDMFLGIVRFNSREDAMANSQRPEQDAWASKMRSLMDGDIEFHDCEEVTEFLDGGSDQAGFVQVIRGHIDDRSLVDALMSDQDALRQMRPDIIGGTMAIEPDGTFTETIAFRDEASARAGESDPAAAPPPEIAEALGKLTEGATFYDLHKPWFESA